MNKPTRIADAHRLDLTHRPRRNRKAEWARRLIRERVLTTDDLIWPLFLIDGEKTRVPVAAMPGVDGLEATRQIRQLEALAGADPTPIIALTADTMRHQLEACLAAGMDAHVAKPINVAELMRALAAATARATPDQLDSFASRASS